MHNQFLKKVLTGGIAAVSLSAFSLPVRAEEPIPNDVFHMVTWTIKRPKKQTCPTVTPIPTETPMLMAPAPSQEQPAKPTDPSKPAPQAPVQPAPEMQPPMNLDANAPSPFDGDLGSSMAMSSQQSLAPNMMGDLFGGGRSGVRFSGGSVALGNAVFHNFGSGIDDFHFANTNLNPAPLTSDFRFIAPSNVFNSLAEAQGAQGVFAVATGSSVTVEEFGALFPNQPLFAIFDAGSGGGGGGVGGFLDVPMPGLNVGRLKIADDSSPLPRDRFIFNYNHFNNVFGNLDVNRFSLGMEKTFFDGLTSLEVRVPFASTADSTQFANGTAENLEMGNAIVQFKGLMYRTETLAVASGAALSSPTADDVKVFMNNVQVVRIRSESFRVLPFVGALWTPGNRWFAQAFGQLDFDLNGDSVVINNGANSVNGVLNFPALLYIDTGVGYFLYQADQSELNDRWITSIAPMVELHYTSALQNGDSVAVGNIFVGDASTTVEQLNLNLATALGIGANASLNLGLVLPLFADDDKQFDWEAQVYFNYRFGNSAR